MNVRLIVLMVPLFIMPIGDLVVNRTLAAIIAQATAAFSVG